MQFDTFSYCKKQLSRVYELEEYNAKTTPIVFGGQTIGYYDTYVEFESIFRYSVLESGPVFWGGENGLTNGRYFYFINYLGINPLWLSMEQYQYVTQMQGYADIPCWPAEGSVQMLEGYAIIKIAD